MKTERLEQYGSGIIGLDEVKAHVRVDGDFEDAELDRMMVSAVIEAQEHASIAFRFQAIRVTLDAWPRSRSLALPIGPLLDWSSVSVTAAGSEFEDFSALTGQRPELRLTSARPAGQISIDYIAGFGETGAEVPEDLRHALLDQVAAYYDARGAVDRKTAALSPHFARIVGRYRGVRS